MLSPAIQTGTALDIEKQTPGEIAVEIPNNPGKCPGSNSWRISESKGIPEEIAGGIPERILEGIQGRILRGRNLWRNPRKSLKKKKKKQKKQEESLEDSREKPKKQSLEQCRMNP